jgi:hypothetical protein
MDGQIQQLRIQSPVITLDIDDQEETEPSLCVEGAMTTMMIDVMI